MKDTIYTIRRSAHRFFSGTVLSRLSGMLRDMTMAYAFGTQSSIAAFMVAFRFAHLLRRLFGEGALQSAFIPEFEALRQQNEPRAFTFFRDLTVLLSCFLILLIGLGAGGLAFCLWRGHLAPHNDETIYLTLLMLPSLLFICLFGLNASLLQCEKSYFTPSVAPVAFNGIWILSVLSIRHLPIQQAMPWLALGVVIACFCQWLLTVPHLWTILKGRSTPSFWSLSHALTSSDLRRLIKPLMLGILGVSASQINTAIDSLFARFADVEGPALLWYAIRLQQLPLALFGIAIAGAVLPPLSRALKNHRWDDYHLFLQDALSRTWAFMLPLTAALFVMGDSCVNLLYGRGDFEPHAVIKTTDCLWAYGVGLLPSAWVLILAPASYAQSNYYLPAQASFLTLGSNLLLNTLFIMGLKWGAMSIALATSLSAWINLLFLLWHLSKTGPLFSSSLLWQGAKMSLATLGAYLGTYKMRLAVQHLPLSPDPLLLPRSFADQLNILCHQLLTFGGLFLINLWILHLLTHPVLDDVKRKVIHFLRN